MKFQTLFLVASAISGVLSAPIREKRAAQPAVVTIYEDVVHVVTRTQTVWVPAAHTKAPKDNTPVDTAVEESSSV